MNDYKLESRKEKYRKCNTNILEIREQMNLSLRKQKLDEMILNKRLRRSARLSENECRLQIDPSTLKIDPKYLSMKIERIETDSEVIFNMLKSADWDYIKYAVYLLRIYTSEVDDDMLNGKEAYMNTMIDSGIFSALVDIIKTAEDPSLIYETSWVLVNLTSIKDLEQISHLDLFATDEFVEIFFKHLHSEFLDIMENIFWIMCHIVVDNVKCRDKILNSKIFGELIKFIRRDENSLDMLRCTLWLLNNIMKNRESVPPERQILECLAAYSAYLYTKDAEVMSHCLYGLYHISYFDDNYPKLHEHIINSGSIVKTLKLNYISNQMAIVPALRLMGNLCAGRFPNVDVIIFIFNSKTLIDLKILDFLDADIFKSYKIHIAWCTANIAAGNYNQVCKVIHTPLFDKMIEYLKDYDYTVKREALYVMSNCTDCNVFEISGLLVSKGVLDLVCDILQKDIDPMLLCVALNVIDNILQSGLCVKGLGENGQGMQNPFHVRFDNLGGYNLLEHLQTHSSEQVYKLSSHILNKYYTTEVI